MGMKTILILISAFLVQAAFGWSPSPSFVAYLKSVEGFRSATYTCAGGYPTIGYGHRLKPGEAITYLSEAQATALLKEDIENAYQRACRAAGMKLEGKTAEILTDFTFNGCGPKQFPKFWKATIAGDTATMRAEYKRYTKGRELKGRNSAFAQRFF